MPKIDESRGFRSPDLHDDADSYGTQDSEEFRTVPADQKLLNDIRDVFSGRLEAMVDGRRYLRRY